MGRLWLSGFVRLQSLAWNLRLACWARRHGDRCDCSLCISCSLAPARFCGGQELLGLEPLRHFGPCCGCEYWGARPAARPQSLRSRFDSPYDTTPAGTDSNILSANVLDTAFDGAVSGATSRQIALGSYDRRKILLFPAFFSC